MTVSFVRLGEVATFRNGLNFSGCQGSGSLRLLGIPDFSSRMVATPHSSRRIHPPGELDPEALLRTGDLVFVRSNGSSELVGRCLLIPTLDEPLTHSGFTIRARIHDRRANAELVAHYFDAGLAREEITRRSGGTNIKNLSQGLLGEVTVPLLGKALEESLLRGLRAISGSIDEVGRLITAKRQLKRRALTAFMDGRARPSRFTGEPWRLMTLGRAGRVVLGATPATTNLGYWDGDIPWCTPTDVTALDGPYISMTSRRITQAGLDSCAAELLPPGSVVVCTRATIGAAAITTVPMATNQGFKSLVPREGVDSTFLYYAICAAHAELVRRGAGSTFPEVSRASFESIPVPCPSLGEQQQITRTLLLMDAELDTLRRMADAYRRLKRALLQKLMRGELALADD